MKKRIIALFLALSMSLSLLSMGAWAAEAELPEDAGVLTEAEESPDSVSPDEAAAADDEEAPGEAAEPDEFLELPACEMVETVTDEAALGDAGTVYSQLSEAVQFVRNEMKARKSEITLDANENIGAELTHNFEALVFAPTDDPCEGDYLRAAVFSITKQISTSNGVSTLTLQITYNDNAALESQATDLVNNTLAGELHLNDPETTDQQKVNNIYQWLTEKVSYNNDATSANPRQADSAFSGAGALVNKSAVCQGYPAAMYRLLKVAGIQARMITSKKLDHAWLIAKLGNHWSLFDPTWDSGRSPKQWRWFNKGKADFVKHDNDDDNFHRDPQFATEHPLRENELDELTHSLGDAPRFTLITHDRGSLSTVAEDGRTKVLVFIREGQDCIDLVQSLNGKSFPGVDIYYVNWVQPHADQQTFIQSVGTASYPTENNPGRYVACANASAALAAFCEAAGIDATNGYSSPMTFVMNSSNQIIFGGFWFPAYFDEYVEDAGLVNENAPASAEPVYYQGAQKVALVGDNAVWHFYEGGTLCITGAGALWPNTATLSTIGWMDSTHTTSWSNDEIEASDIKQVTIASGITELGHNLFYYCTNLESITFTGDAPTLGQALTGKAVTVRCPADNDTWTGVSGSNSFYPGTVWESVGSETPPISLQDATVTIAPMTYNGSAQTASVTVTLNGTPLSIGEDFTVTDATQTDAGTYTLTITGMGNYTGSQSVGFTIAQASLSGAVLTLSPAGYAFDGRAKTPGVQVVWSGTELKSGTDYAVSFENNTNAGTATATVTGMGNYTGSQSVGFTISQASLSDAALTLPAVSYSYDGKAKTPSVKVVANGATLTNGTDYTVSFKNNTKPGKATVTVTGKGNYSGTKAVSFTIKKGTITVPATATTVKGKTVKLKVTGGAKVTYQSGNTKIATVTSKGVVKGIAPGKVTITVKDAGNSNYNKATKKVTVTVTPPAPAGVSVKNSKAKTTTVAWRAMSGITGYELQASMDKTFQSGVKKAAGKQTATSAVFKSLTKGKTWYVRVRCYKTVSGKKIYSTWGAVKAIKITR